MKHTLMFVGFLSSCLTACQGPFPIGDLIDDLPVDGTPGGDDDVPAPPSEACLFGETFYELRTSERLALSADEWIRDEAQLTDPVEQAQLVAAVRQSSHSDVTTVAEALARVDQQEVRRIWLTPVAGEGPRYVVYEYGAGDNSYGAFFAVAEPTVLASIHDGDVLDCAVFE